MTFVWARIQEFQSCQEDTCFMTEVGKVHNWPQNHKITIDKDVHDVQYVESLYGAFPEL